MGSKFNLTAFSSLTKLFLVFVALIITVLVLKQEQQFVKKVYADTPVKIMVVGDSISQGHSGDYTWRYRLWQHLASSGASVDFVGPKNTVYDDTNPNSTDYLDPNFDNEHDATWGRPTIYEKDTIASEMQSATPDLLLVDLGTNDLAWGYSDVAGALDSMRTLIINARSVNPNVKIVLSLLTPRTVSATDPWITNRTNYNAGLQTLASQMTTVESPVVISDPTNGFDDTVDTYDGTHPTPSGEYKIAAGFSDALATNFGIGTLFGQIPPAPAWPQAPVIQSATPGDGQATITWSFVPGASGYYIHVRNVTRGESFTRLPYAIAGPTFTGGYLINGETYEFAVSTNRGNVDGPMSTPIQVIPDVPLLPGPTGLTAQALDGGVKLDWNAVGTSWFYIYMRNVTRGESFVRLPYPVSTNTFTGGYMINGETYEFKLTTINTANKEGPFSDTVSVIPVPPVPVAPTGLTANGGLSSVSLSWTASSGSASYNIYLKDVTANQTTFTKIASTSGVNYSATSLINGHAYQFQVSGVNLGGEGALSSVASATPLAPLPAPTGLKVTAGVKSATLTWTSVSGAASYQIWIRKGSTGSFTKSSKVVGTSSSAIISSLTTGAIYYFKISSINANDLEGAASAAVKSAAIK